MKVLGIYVYESFFSKIPKKYPLFSYQNISVGFTLILNEIQKEGNHLDTIACSLGSDINNVLKNYDVKKYDLACFTSFSSQIKYTYKFARVLKKINPKIKITVGGPHATLFPEDVLSHREIDSAAIGEGCTSIKLYLKYLKGNISAEKVKGYWIREKDKVIKNGVIEFSDFKNFPVIDRSIWKKWVYDSSRHVILLARGCANRCSYCSNHRFKTKNTGQYISFRKTDDIIAELKYLHKNYKNLKHVALESETLAANMNFAYELLDKLGRFNSRLKNKIIFTINLHLTPFLKKDIEKFTKALNYANVKFVCIGLESGSHRIRKNILCRPEYNNEEFIWFCRYLMNKGIFISIFVLLGLPTETEYNLKQTIKILEKIKPDEIRHSIFYPYPKTEIHDLMVKMKLIKPDQMLNAYPERRSVCMDYPDLSGETIMKYYNKLENMMHGVRLLVMSKMLKKQS